MSDTAIFSEPEILLAMRCALRDRIAEIRLDLPKADPWYQTTMRRELAAIVNEERQVDCRLRHFADQHLAKAEDMR